MSSSLLRPRLSWPSLLCVDDTCDPWTVAKGLKNAVPPSLIVHPTKHKHMYDPTPTTKRRRKSYHGWPFLELVVNNIELIFIMVLEKLWLSFAATASYLLFWTNALFLMMLKPEQFPYYLKKSTRPRKIRQLFCFTLSQTKHNLKYCMYIKLTSDST